MSFQKNNLVYEIQLETSLKLVMITVKKVYSNNFGTNTSNFVGISIGFN